MPSYIITPNMNLLEPNVGGVNASQGPDYANQNNSSLTLIDQHDHTPGKGVQLTPSGLNINSDLDIQSNNIIRIRSTRFVSQPAALALASDLGCLYESGVDLYFNDGSGNQIRLTQGGSIVGTAGSITGLPSGTASASFSAGTFVWQSATNTAANMDAGSYIYRNNTANSKGLTLSPPNAMAADYSLVLPSLPASTLFVTLDSSGNLGTAVGIASTQIADGSITYVKRSPLNIGASGITSVTASSSSYVGIASTVFTTSGKPVFISLTGNAGATVSYLESVGGLSRLQFLRNGIPIVTHSFGVVATDSRCPASTFACIDSPAANSYTYLAQIAADSSSSVSAVNIGIQVWEMG